MSKYDGYIKIHGPRPPRPLNSKFEISLVKIFSLKQKKIKYFQQLQKKSDFVSSRKELHVPSDFPSNSQFYVNVEISNHALNQIRDCNGEMQIKSYSGRFRHIHTCSGIFRHNPAYSGIIQAYLEPYATLVIQSPVKHLRWSILQKQ